MRPGDRVAAGDTLPRGPCDPQGRATALRDRASSSRTPLLPLFPLDTGSQMDEMGLHPSARAALRALRGRSYILIRESGRLS